ncbi:MAG: DUF1549 domain-containing protein, partial [Verrucomicrobiales bacterium]|nr:DUF1549 domain-containing protein [Verrucomicrobiales bacterium]
MIHQFIEGASFSQLSSANELAIPFARIDELLSASWKSHGIEAPAPASDETFVPRAYLDLVGRIPTRLEALAFLEDSDAEKRDRVVGSLLKSAPAHFEPPPSPALRWGGCGRAEKAIPINSIITTTSPSYP